MKENTENNRGSAEPRPERHVGAHDAPAYFEPVLIIGPSLSKYGSSFLLALVPVCAILSMLSFAVRSQVRAGVTMEETWTNTFTLDASSNQMYRIDDDVRADLEKGIAFIGSGVVHVRSTKVEITPQEVSWTENKTKYTAPGARMVARVTWDTPADAGDGDKGDIHVEFPRMPSIPNYTVAFHSGASQKTGDGRWVFREVTAHRSAASVAIGRFFFVLSAGLPMTFLLHGIWWAFQLKSEKRALLAGLAQPSVQPLPRVFYPDPIAEWLVWTLTLCISGGWGSLMASFAIYDSFQSSVFVWLLFIMQGIGVVIALIVALYVRSSVVSVRIDADAISYAKGRGEPQWITARWSELKGAVVKSETYRGTTIECVELIFPDGKTRKIPSSVIDYPTLRNTMIELYARQHQSV